MLCQSLTYTHTHTLNGPINTIYITLSKHTLEIKDTRAMKRTHSPLAQHITGEYKDMSDRLTQWPVGCHTIKNSTI